MIESKGYWYGVSEANPKKLKKYGYFHLHKFRPAFKSTCVLDLLYFYFGFKVKRDVFIIEKEVKTSSLANPNFILPFFQKITCIDMCQSTLWKKLVIHLDFHIYLYSIKYRIFPLLRDVE